MFDREYWALKGNQAFEMDPRAAGGDRVIASVVQVRVERTKKLCVFQHEDLTLRPGQRVVVETERGTSSAEIITWPVKRWCSARSMKFILRNLDTAQDRISRTKGQAKEEQAMRVCRDLIATFQLEMKLVGVEYVYWENRTVFFFVADGRVDFRDLVKELSRVLRCRIEMRQIGPRDETKMLGGLGRCGREFCCGTFLNEFRSVRTKMAKEQGLVVNQEKITGHCRKLLCCLAYERESYAALRSALPPLGALVDTEKGEGKVVELLVLKQSVKVQLFDKGDTYEVFPVSALKVKGGGKLNADGLSLLDGDDDADDEAMRELEDDGDPSENGAENAQGRERDGGQRRQGGHGTGPQQRRQGGPDSPHGRSDRRGQDSRPQHPGRNEPHGKPAGRNDGPEHRSGPKPDPDRRNDRPDQKRDDRPDPRRNDRRPERRDDRHNDNRGERRGERPRIPNAPDADKPEPRQENPAPAPTPLPEGGGDQ